MIRDPERRLERDVGNDQPGREGHLRMFRIGTGIRGGASAARGLRAASARRMLIARGDVASRGVDDRCQVKL